MEKKKQKKFFPNISYNIFEQRENLNTYYEDIFVNYCLKYQFIQCLALSEKENVIFVVKEILQCMFCGGLDLIKAATLKLD